MTHAVPLAGVVLAAGGSRRFQGDKRLLRLASGKTLFQAALEPIAAHVTAIYVAIRPGEEVHESWPAFLSAAEIHYLPAARAKLGMGFSLADAVRCVPPGMGLMIALADMPYIQGQTVARLAASFRHSTKSAPIVFPTFSARTGMPGDGHPREARGIARRGHPVIFHHSYRDQLLELTGDSGASRIIEANPQAQVEVEVEDAGVLFDIDSPEDVDALGVRN